MLLLFCVILCIDSFLVSCYLLHINLSFHFQVSFDTSFFLLNVRCVEQSYALQEAFIADQLFQSSDHSSDDILWLSHAVFPSSKVL